jgi:hypothetical protein
VEDPGIVRKVRSEGRIVLTFDLDFGEILALSKKPRVPGTTAIAYVVCDQIADHQSLSGGVSHAPAHHLLHAESFPCGVVRFL